MPSVTYWSRLEPRPRSPSIWRGLGARVRDPLWMLTRQWQFGEFQGEDAGSPAYAELSYRFSPLTGWRVEGQPTQELRAPLEALVHTEPLTPDYSLRVELGQTFERLLAQALAPEPVPADVLTACRRAYPLASEPQATLLALLFSLGLEIQSELADATTVSEPLRLAFQVQGVNLSPDAGVSTREEGRHWLIIDEETGRTYALLREANEIRTYSATLPDGETTRFLRVCAGRVVDGIALYEAARASLPLLPPALVVDPAHEAALAAALGDVVGWVQEVFGAGQGALPPFGTEDPPAWDAARLEYGCEVVADTGAGGATVLAARPGPNGEFDWHAFDFRSARAGDPQLPVDERRRCVLPIHVRFRGMPNARWWDFETSTMDFGAIRPDRRDVAKLLVVDFMLIHGNDWFVIPVAQPVGTLCHVRSLIVHDVFGDLTLIDRADAGAALGGPRWTLFSTSVEGDPAQLASFFLLPPSASIAAEASPPLEEIRFLRDDMANLVWAIEHTAENGVGQPWLGSERDRAVRPAPVTPSPAAAPREPDRPPLRYRIQTTVPTHWIPFLPVAIDRPQGDIALERGVMLRSVLGASAQPTEPVGRILRPTTLGLTPYRIREEEVPRSGVRILRVACRSRWTDGSTYLWLSRRKTAGAGEGRSGLRFDIAERNK